MRRRLKSRKWFKEKYNYPVSNLKELEEYSKKRQEEYEQERTEEQKKQKKENESILNWALKKKKNSD